MRRNPWFLVYSAGAGAATTVDEACRAGALGVLDLCWAGPLQTLQAFALVRQVARRSDRSFAVRIEARAVSAAWLATLPPTAKTLIVVATTAEGTELAAAIEQIHAASRLGWAEVCTREAAALAEVSGADGLIVVGHEAGGLVGHDSSFVLLLAFIERSELPIWVRGGVGARVAAGCFAAGAAGVVLDGVLLMTRDSPLLLADQAQIEHWVGTGTSVFGPPAGPQVRVSTPPGSSIPDRLQAASATGDATWHAALCAEVGWEPDQAWPIGQDSALAGEFGQDRSTVADLIRTFKQTVSEHGRAALANNPLGVGSSLALAHGTRYPILQGPMTPTSDLVEFADAAARYGALPFVPLAMLRGHEVDLVLRQVRKTLGARPWGVGLLGFVSPELQREQVAAVLAARPPFALIAGSRPDQARELDDAGITTYFHVVSQRLLDQLFQAGKRRFVLAGREAGGPMGPQLSFVLWEQALAAVDRAIAAGATPGDFHLVFAGEIHDARSARFVATMSALAARGGVKVGILMGSDALFTAKPFATTELKPMNGKDSKLVPGAHADRLNGGISLPRPVATRTDPTTTVADLYRSIAENQSSVDRSPTPPAAHPADIAIVGMSAVLPGAADVRTFWENTLRKHDAVTEVPADRWDWRLYYDADPKAPDKVISKWGGFVPEVEFDPLRYGMPPSSLPSIEPVQLLLLEATRAAMKDAGYADRPFARDRDRGCPGDGRGSGTTGNGVCVSVVFAHARRCGHQGRARPCSALVRACFPSGLRTHSPAFY